MELVEEKDVVFLVIVLWEMVSMIVNIKDVFMIIENIVFFEIFRKYIR